MSGALSIDTHSEVVTALGDMERAGVTRCVVLLHDVPMVATPEDLRRLAALPVRATAQEQRRQEAYNRPRPSRRSVAQRQRRKQERLESKDET
jgi:hypothetical protein